MLVSALRLTWSSGRSLQASMAEQSSQAQTALRNFEFANDIQVCERAVIAWKGTALTRTLSDQTSDEIFRFDAAAHRTQVDAENWKAE